MTSHLLLLDASGFAHRAFHTGGNQFRSDGLPTYAITGFMALMWKLLGAARADQPTHACACFDAPGKTFRHKLFKDYKNNRPARTQELAAQWPFMHHAAEAMGVRPLDLAGYEADDLVATLATRAVKAGMRVTIVSSDKDFCQLVKDGEVEIVDPVQHVRILEADVRSEKKFGVPPSLVPDFQALAGDPVDNIPGIDGIGQKAAARYVRLFGTIEGVVGATTSRPGYFTPMVRTRLRESLPQLKLYRKLATLKRDVPLLTPLDGLILRPIIRDHVEKMLVTLEAKGRFDAIFAGEPKFDRVVEALPSPEEALEWWAEELKAPGQRIPDGPQCGFYERRLVKGGPRVPARIWRDPELDPVTGEPTSREVLRCQVGTKRADAVTEWGRLAMRPITKAKYEFEIADGAWCRMHAPHDPKACPEKVVDLTKVPVPVFNQPESKSSKRKKHGRSKIGRRRQQASRHAAK